MEYRSKDFENLFLNVYEVPANQDLFTVFPILSNYDAFRAPLNERLNIQSVIRYIVYAFDHNTPLFNIPDIIERRVNAAFLAGFSHDNTGKFNDDIELMLKSRNGVVNNMIIQYAIIQANDDYVAMIAYQDTLRRKSKDLLDGDETYKAGENITVIENCRKHIASIRQQLLTTEKDSLLNRSLYIFQEAQRLKLRPEDIAKALMEHDPIFKQLRGF